MSQATSGGSNSGIDWGSLLSPLVGAGVSQLFGQTPTAPSGPINSNVQQGALQNWLQIQQQLQKNNPYSAVQPFAGQTFNSQFNNPYASGYQSASGQAGAASGAVGGMDIASSGLLNSASLAALGPALQTLVMGFDPQNALYQRTAQQTGDQLSAYLAQNGLNSSPAGAGIFSQGMNNFNIDWQNNLLKRALDSLSGFGTSVGQTANNLTGASNLGGSGIQDILFGGQSPFDTANSIAGNQNSAIQSLLGVLSGGSGYNQQLLGNWNNLLGLGQTQNSQALAALQQQQQSQAAQEQGLGQIFGPAISTGINYLANNAGSILGDIGSFLGF